MTLLRPVFGQSFDARPPSVQPWPEDTRVARCSAPGHLLHGERSRRKSGFGRPSRSTHWCPILSNGIVTQRPGDFLSASAASTQQADGTYNSFHPKLGIEKVDRATGAVVHSQDAAHSSAEADIRSGQTKYRLEPKGNYRVIKAPVPGWPQGANAEARN